MEQRGQMTVRGDPDAVDSFAACLAAVAERFARRSDYPYIAALTGTCFSPCHNRGEVCIGWKLDGGSAARVGFIAQTLGLAVEEIFIEPGAPEDWTEEYRRSKAAPEQAINYFSRLRADWMDGKAVVLATWPGWSILKNWDANWAQLPFATTPGFEKIVSQIWPPLKTRIAYAFGPGDDTLPVEEVVRAALAYGGQIAAGSVVPQVSNFGVENYFGGELYYVVLRQVDEKFLCGGCNENGCFSRAVRRIHDGHESSLTFLQEAQTTIGPLPGLAEAITAYADLTRISNRYSALSSDRNIFDDADLRPWIKTDFTRMKGLHREAAGYLQLAVAG